MQLKMQKNLIYKYIALLTDGHADFAATSFSQTKKRSDIIDFISIFMEEYQQLFIRNPNELYDWEVYMMPFTKQAWWGTFAFIILTPFLLSISTVDCKCNQILSKNLFAIFNVFRSLMVLISYYVIFLSFK